MQDVGELIHRISELERRLANSDREGTIEEIKDGFVRVKWAEKGHDGKPVITGWLPQSDTHFGNVREEIPFRKGQNVRLSAPGGDYSRATLTPYSPNEKMTRPGHANDKQATYQWNEQDDDGNDKEDGLAQLGTRDPKLHDRWIGKKDANGERMGGTTQNDGKSEIRFGESSYCRVTADEAILFFNGHHVRITAGQIEIKHGGDSVIVGGGVVHLNP